FAVKRVRFARRSYGIEPVRQGKFRRVRRLKERDTGVVRNVSRITDIAARSWTLDFKAPVAVQRNSQSRRNIRVIGRDATALRSSWIKVDWRIAVRVVAERIAICIHSEVMTAGWNDGAVRNHESHDAVRCRERPAG